VKPSWPSPSAYQNVGDAPMNWDAPWTTALQGVAHSDKLWYMSQEKYICKIPIDEDMTRFGDWYTPSSWCMGPVFPDFKFHYGDLDVANGKLFVPIESNIGRFLAVLRDDAPADYHVRDMPLETIIPMYGHSNFAWLAINPRDGLLYTSMTFDASSLRAYKILWPEGARTKVELAFARDIPLLSNGQPLALKSIQGGAFSPNGHLYLVSGDPDNTAAGGIYGVDTNGVVYEHIPFEYHPGGLSDEPEGIDFLDLDQRGSGMGKKGQLHMVMIDLDWSSPDDLYFKHFRVNDSRP
jgi:hypothetical protein